MTKRRYMTLSWTSGPDGVIDFDRDHLTLSDGAGTVFEQFEREKNGHWVSMDNGYRYANVFHALNQSGAMHVAAARMVEQFYLAYDSYLETEAETGGK